MRSLIFLLLITCSLHGELSTAEPVTSNVGPLLETEISWTPEESQSEKVSPAGAMVLTATVRNVGTEASAPGTIFLEYSFKDPALQAQQTNVLYQSESCDLVSIDPGQSVSVTFSRCHRWPTLEDFIRQDWPSRAYKAYISIRGKKSLTGIASIAFEAHYVNGPKQPIAVVFENVDHTRQSNPRLEQAIKNRIHR